MAAAVIDLHPFRTGTVSVDESTHASLKYIGSTGATDAEFATVLSVALEALTGRTTATRDDSIPSKLAPGAAAFQAVVLDFARCNTPASGVEHALEEHGFKATRVKIVVEAYIAHLEAIRSTLEASGQSLPKLVDLKWRLDYLLASSEGGKLGKPMYHIDFHMVEVVRGAVRPFVHSFTCTPQELEELRARIKDGLRAVAALVPR